MKMAPLQNSFEQNGFEDQIRKLAIKLYDDKIARDVQDIVMSGIPYQEGISFEYLQRVVLRDGLSLLDFESNPNRLRHLLRLWLSQKGTHKRGLKFLKKYIDILYRGDAKVTQLWLDASRPYPSTIDDVATNEFRWWRIQLNESGKKVLNRGLPGAFMMNKDYIEENRKDNRVSNNPNLYLSSRVRVSLSLDAKEQRASRMRETFRRILPARFVIDFKLWEAEAIEYYKNFMSVDVSFVATLYPEIQYPWSAPVVTSDTSRAFRVTNPGTTRLGGNYVDIEIKKV